MNAFEFSFRDQSLHALPSGGLFWPLENMLVVSDLHLGKSTRAARFGGAQLPPYETTETLTRLATDLINTGARRIICLGDSFDSPDLQTALPEADLLTLATLRAGLDWVWIEGNHDPGPVQLGGTHRGMFAVAAATPPPHLPRDRDVRGRSLWPLPPQGDTVSAWARAGTALFPVR